MRVRHATNLHDNRQAENDVHVNNNNSNKRKQCAGAVISVHHVDTHTNFNARHTKRCFGCFVILL